MRVELLRDSCCTPTLTWDGSCLIDDSDDVDDVDDVDEAQYRAPKMKDARKKRVHLHRRMCLRYRLPHGSSRVGPRPAGGPVSWNYFAGRAGPGFKI